MYVRYCILDKATSIHVIYYTMYILHTHMHTHDDTVPQIRAHILHIVHNIYYPYTYTHTKKRDIKREAMTVSRWLCLGLRSSTVYNLGTSTPGNERWRERRRHGVPNLGSGLLTGGVIAWKAVPYFCPAPWSPPFVRSRWRFFPRTPKGPTHKFWKVSALVQFLSIYFFSARTPRGPRHGFLTSGL